MPYFESMTATTSVPSLLMAIQQQNATTLQQHQQRFQHLVEKYVDVEEEVYDDKDNNECEEEERMEDAQTVTKQSTPTTKISEMDPLTAMLMEQKAEETRKAELMLKYKKERARLKRGLVTEGRYIGSESEGGDQASVSRPMMIHMVSCLVR